jgi:fluoride exporter
MAPRWLYELALVASGGCVGAVLRFLMNGVCARISWPCATLLVNATGSLLVGVAIGIAQAVPESGQTFRDCLRLFFVVGLLGSLTTFSAFSYETVFMLRQGQVLAAFVNIFANLGICLTLCALGLAVAMRYSPAP